MKKPVIGLALGSGSARGLAHIGIIKALDEMGIKPDIVCGTSIGSIIGASYVNGNLIKLEKGFKKLTKYQILKFININLVEGNFIDREKLKIFFNDYIGNETQKIEKLSKKYGAIATSFNSGEEVEFLEGNLYDAVFSSIALPGLFSPYFYKGDYMLDGGIVNPVPISLCKKLGADIVIAVDLNASLMLDNNEIKDDNQDILNFIGDNEFFKKIYNRTEKYFNKNNKKEEPNLFKTIFKTIDIMQFKITNDRLKNDKPDIVLRPELSSIGVLDFDKIDECMFEGIKCVKKSEAKINKIVNTNGIRFFAKIKKILKKLKI